MRYDDDQGRTAVRAVQVEGVERTAWDAVVDLNAESAHHDSRT